MTNVSERMFRALAREGLDVSVSGSIYTVKIKDDEGPTAEILLPADLPVEAKAFQQLASLAATRHPEGGCVSRAIATPDFHQGDAGVAIGSVVESADLVIPQAVGVDINCGMRLHTCSIPVETFLDRVKKQQWVDLMKGDYLLGTRDLVFRAETMSALFEEGVPAWLNGVKGSPLGCLKKSDLDQIESETERIFELGSLVGSAEWAPDSLRVVDGQIRDPGIGTIGKGNHFCEVQYVSEIKDRHLAWEWGLKKEQLIILIHSGSREVGRSIGRRWEDKARAAWPAGHRFPDSGIFPLRRETKLASEYLKAEATAANYGFVNRLLLAELCRLRLREVYGQDIEMPLMADIPHNITLIEDGKVKARKGACPAHKGQPVLIPGSMGASSFICVGQGNERFLCSASHGAGRLSSRGSMGRVIRDEEHKTALGLQGVECITLHEERILEEAPSAYKPIGPVIEAQENAGIISVVAITKPILTFKA